MRLVILESPLAGDVVVNQQYARLALLDSLRRGESPLASHLLYPQVLDDAAPDERHLGIEAGLAWGRYADATVVYTDKGVSDGMKQGINRALAEGRVIAYRSLESYGV
jgi:hypothetical protein